MKYNKIVKKCEFTKKAFTLTEAIITMLMIGLIAILCTGGIKLLNPSESAMNTSAIKMAQYIDQALLQIIINHCSFDDLSKINDRDGHFSIEDLDATMRISRMFQENMSDIALGVDMNREYFSKPLLDYNRTSVGSSIKSLYSHFYYVNDGMLIGYRTYGTCNAIETNANPPDNRGRFSVEGICGSIFYDINAYKGPNKLGSDQYIIPLQKRGTKYSNEDVR